MSLSIYAEGEDSKICVNIKEINEPPSSLPTTSANKSTSEPRLKLLDGKFFKYLPESSTSNKIVALCRKCSPKKIQVRGYNNCTSNFLSHLKRKHGDDCVEEYKNYIKNKKVNKLMSGESTSNTTISGKVSTTFVKVNEKTKVLTQERFDENIVKFFIHSMIPLRAIENPYFSQIFVDLNISDINLKVISRRTLSRRIQDYYTKEIAEISSKLRDINYVCTMVDMWSDKKRSFIGVTAHWITKDLCRKSVALACRRFKGTHNYDRICELVQEINCEFGLTVNKITSTIANNGRNFAKAFKLFGVQLTNVNMIYRDEVEDLADAVSSDSEDAEEEEIRNVSNLDKSDVDENCSLLANLRCCAHTLSLCATTDANNVLKEQNSTRLSTIHNAVMIKCNTLWKAAKRPKSAEIIKDILQHTLSRPNETRWNSVFESLQQIYSIKNKSLELHNALNINNAIKDTEYEYIQEYLMCAAPVTEALDIMNGENNTYYGIVLPCLFALKKKLKKIESKHNLVYCKTLIGTYVASIERRFSQFYDLSTPESQYAAIAALSFPRFKNKWLSCVEPTQQSQVLNIFKIIISEEINEKPEAESRATKNTKKENTFFSFDSDSDSESSEVQFMGYSEAPIAKAERLMLHFFDEENQELEVLNRYPEIKNIFIKYNTILPSSASVGRLFSYATRTNLRNSDQMFEKTVVLKANLNYNRL